MLRSWWQHSFEGLTPRRADDGALPKYGLPMARSDIHSDTLPMPAPTEPRTVWVDGRTRRFDRSTVSACLGGVGLRCSEGAQVMIAPFVGDWGP